MVVFMNDERLADQELNRKLDSLQHIFQDQVDDIRQEAFDWREETSSQQKVQVEGLKLDIDKELSAVKHEIELLQLMKQEVDTLQVEVMQPRTWYKDASVIISLVAVVFSFGTAMISFLQIDTQNKYAARSELRGLIQRLGSLPKERAEVVKAYKDDAFTSNLLTGGLAQEYMLLANQAVDISNRIPNDISPIEYIAISKALTDAGSLEQVPVLLDRGLRVSKDVVSKVGLLRGYGSYFIMTGDFDSGRKKYQEAIRISNQESRNQSLAEGSNAYTELIWAISEHNQGQCKQAENLLSNVLIKAEKLPRGEYADSLKAQVLNVQEGIKRNPQICK
jgi:tetratricopeptide (TPR) repeat protein